MPQLQPHPQPLTSNPITSSRLTQITHHINTMPIPTSITQPTTETPSNSSTQANEVTSNEIPARETTEKGEEAEEDRGEGRRTGMSAEEAAEKLYEERMEDEYAKREGGA
ncbi:hypothetical protein GLAREA_00096 [Glarea lozoyensis ATCC 20868]|uniref:Uncharacterized protein n=1 Tax=Glarea lozoyensis (strain ATCC 20868 / MF5171) TaxID=1116229 RepID=S3DR45_GLAL2|nr:uncharacterized protein GLAREA_00096 [Glarea lozoyensis ATCC 20868]EPE28938.1 hypothetical protein GLAREA_00096 [Glarea lozoyensis ATCC 20868]